MKHVTIFCAKSLRSVSNSHNDSSQLHYKMAHATTHLIMTWKYLLWLTDKRLWHIMPTLIQSEHIASDFQHNCGWQLALLGGQALTVLVILLTSGHPLAQFRQTVSINQAQKVSQDNTVAVIHLLYVFVKHLVLTITTIFCGGHPSYRLFLILHSWRDGMLIITCLLQKLKPNLLAWEAMTASVRPHLIAQ